ncbi:hypothetical protein EV714DRAFT_275056 [Schizophyllum commune]
MSGPIPVEADMAKAQGNSAFAAGDCEQAATHYTRAVELAPRRVAQDATHARDGARLSDGQWGKGYARLAEAMLMDVEAEEAGEEAMSGTREEGRGKMLEEAQEALHHAVHFSEGRVLEEAQRMMEDVTARLEVLYSGGGR